MNTSLAGYKITYTSGSHRVMKSRHPLHVAAFRVVLPAAGVRINDNCFLYIYFEV